MELWVRRQKGDGLEREKGGREREEEEEEAVVFAEQILLSLGPNTHILGQELPRPVMK